jgi:hypothetical protein
MNSEHTKRSVERWINLAAFYINCEGIQVLEKYGLHNTLDVYLSLTLNYRLIYICGLKENGR